MRGIVSSMAVASIAGVVLVLPNCGKPPCSQTCTTGCCDSNGACQAGTADTACGSAAKTCENCTPSAKTCSFNSCTAVTTRRDGGCDSATCSAGCCDTSGVCQPGTFDTACGANGNNCSNCAPSGDQCVNHACVRPCGPGNCSGCCDSTGACRAGSDATACGTAGAACADCSAQAQVCVAAKCYPAGCNPGTCGGCCDANLICRSGFSDSTCGTGGGACSDCALGGKTCVNRTCVCPQRSSFLSATTAGGYRNTGANAPPNDATVGTQWSRTTAPAENVTVTVWHGRPATPFLFPERRTFSTSTKFGTCDVCALYGKDCDPTTGRCAVDYLAQGGSVTVFAADKLTTGGRIRATGTSLHFVEWDFAADRPVSNGGCLDLGTLDMTISW